MTRVERFDAAHHDKVVALHINFDGSRVLTASVDHRIKAWTRDEDTGELKLLDKWRAHDGDIKDAKWFHPTTGTHIASCGADRILRIFTLDPGAAPLSGRTFQPIAQISSKSPVPFVSLDIKNVANVYTYLAVIDRQGLVTVFVPENPDKFTAWAIFAQWSVCSPLPGNGEETSFKVRWDPNLSSLAYYSGLTDERNSLGLVVTAMDQVKVYHAVLGGPGNSAEFFEVASTCPSPQVLLRDVQWAPFNVRGVDLLAIASRNGDITIVEMSHAPNPENSSASTTGSYPRQASSRPVPQSSLTTAIAGRSNMPASPKPATSPASRILPYSTHLKVTTTLTHAHDDTWSLAWDPAGQILLSNGSEGRTSMWKKSIMQGEWKQFSSTEFDIKEDGEGEEWVM